MFWNKCSINFSVSEILQYDEYITYIKFSRLNSDFWPTENIAKGYMLPKVHKRHTNLYVEDKFMIINCGRDSCIKTQIINLIELKK